MPPRRQLILFAVLVPALVAAFNQALIATLPHNLLQVWFYPAMAGSIAVLSWCTGRYLKCEWLSWVVFAWSLALLNLMTIAVCMSGPIDKRFAYLMVTSQMCLVVLWAILGTVRWQWRVPFALVATPMVVLFAGVFIRTQYGRWRSPPWVALMVIATLVIAALCGTLRAAGFTLRMPRKTSIALPNDEPGRVFQFGVRHMLIWSAALVPLLLVGRGIDFVILNQFRMAGIFSLIVIAASLAVINLTAIWATLGVGPLIVRIVALIVVPLGFAYALDIYTSQVIAGVRSWSYDSMVHVIKEIGGTWKSWLCTGAMLLAALLLFLRAKGYVLERKV